MTLEEPDRGAALGGLKGGAPSAWGSLAQAAEATDVDELLSTLESWLNGATLYAVDHQFRLLVPLRDIESEVPLVDGLLDDVLALRSHLAGSTVWTPLPHRSFPLLVARSTDGSSPDRASARLCASVFAAQRLLFDALEHRLRRQGMTAAANLQWDQLPTRAARIDGFAAAGALEPAHRVAGDLFDLAVNPAGALAALALDAMGHGTASALSGVLALSAIRNIRREGGSLVDQVAEANRLIGQHWGGDRFVTLVALEATATELQVVNAGHEPLRRVTDHEVNTLSVPADPPLGATFDASYRLTKLEPLALGESLVLLSDGAHEARSPDGTEFGEQRVNELVGGSLSPTSLGAAHRVCQAVRGYVGGDLHDDLTVLVISREGNDV